QEVDIVTSGPGIKLFNEQLDPVKDTVEINFELFRNRGYFQASTNLRLFSKYLKNGLSAIAVNPDTISLAFAEEHQKKVPVRLDLEWDLPPSYRVSPSSMRFMDSVHVIGPLDSLERITDVKTVHFKLPYSIEPQTVFIPFDSVGAMQMMPNGVTLSYTPRPFTEKVIRIPVIAKNLPANIHLRFDPDTVEARLLLPLEHFESVHAHTLSAEVDFPSIRERSKFVIPRIRPLPQDAILLAFSPFTIRYVIITREWP
ncbi:MAG: hypothetical protein RLZZ165_1216, partial [Bacteroidota bacterium]